MPLRYFWAMVPCRGPVRRPPSPREDVSEVPVGRVAVPKDGQKNASPRGDATEMPVGGVVVPKTASRVGLRIVLRNRPEDLAEQRVENRVKD